MPFSPPSSSVDPSIDRARPILLATIVTLLIAPAGFGLEPDTEPEEQALAPFVACRGIDNDIARLQCFDDAVSALDLEDDMASSATDEAATAEPDAATAETVEPQIATAETTTAELDTDPASMKPRRPTDWESLVEAEEADVAGCDYLGNVTGKSGWGGSAASGKGRRNSTRAAKKDAAELGATHIVIGTYINSSGMRFSRIRAQAYACD